ncbi:hypothetical protein [Trichloromonas acetexigens]|jgi:hypothetical protein|uniref:Uncharacterized protein n=1 Tax=Trichloromonas acetexigens TaxID=38815 RepID=A0A550J796_9BACT|nr:hypothetical protein [Desulfuromonas acetexigens]TRO79101.1 hypothetical protein FL622_14040 [Desulfuromonas acetexigens]
MNAIARIAAATAVLSTVATSAFAATGAASGGGLLVWLFLGFLGLIVATQLVPAVMLLSGIIQGVTSGSAAEESAR